MFDAVISRKARLDRIIDGVGKQPREDLITSSLFGTLRYLTPDARARALQVLTGGEISGDTKIFLWPRLGLGNLRTEPDVVIVYDDGHGLTHWIVEVKWGASLGTAQIEREITAVRAGKCNNDELRRGIRNVAGYTLLGQEPHHSIDVGSAQKKLNLPIFGLSWPSVAARLRDLDDADDGYREWAKTVTDFLTSSPRGKAFRPWPQMSRPSPDMFTFNIVFPRLELVDVLPSTFMFTGTTL